MAYVMKENLADMSKKHISFGWWSLTYSAYFQQWRINPGLQTQLRQEVLYYQRQTGVRRWWYKMTGQRERKESLLAYCQLLNGVSSAQTFLSFSKPPAVPVEKEVSNIKIAPAARLTTGPTRSQGSEAEMLKKLEEYRQSWIKVLEQLTVISRCNYSEKGGTNSFKEKVKGQIEQAFRQAAKSLHPDKYGKYSSSTQTRATEIFQEIKALKEKKLAEINALLVPSFSNEWRRDLKIPPSWNKPLDELDAELAKFKERLNKMTAAEEEIDRQMEEMLERSEAFLASSEALMDELTGEDQEVKEQTMFREKIDAHQLIVSSYQQQKEGSKIESHLVKFKKWSEKMDAYIQRKKIEHESWLQQQAIEKEKEQEKDKLWREKMKKLDKMQAVWEKQMEGRSSEKEGCRPVTTSPSVETTLMQADILIEKITHEQVWKTLQNDKSLKKEKETNSLEYVGFPSYTTHITKIKLERQQAALSENPEEMERVNSNQLGLS